MYYLCTVIKQINKMEKVHMVLITIMSTIVDSVLLLLVFIMLFISLISLLTPSKNTSATLN